MIDTLTKEGLLDTNLQNYVIIDKLNEIIMALNDMEVSIENLENEIDNG